MFLKSSFQMLVELAERLKLNNVWEPKLIMSEAA